VVKSLAMQGFLCLHVGVATYTSTLLALFAVWLSWDPHVYAAARREIYRTS